MTSTSNAHKVGHCSSWLLVALWYILLYIFRLLDDVVTGEGGSPEGHGMVLALHMMKQLKSFQKFSKLLTTKYDDCISSLLHCLKPFHNVSISVLCLHHRR